MTTKSKPHAKPVERIPLREEAKALFRDAVLRAAEEVFAERGFHGARIQDIAERARIGVGTVYNHFAQKEDVLRALVEQHQAAIADDFAPHPDDPADWEGKLRATWSRLVARIERHRGFFRIAFEMGLFGPPSVDAAAPLGEQNERRRKHERLVAFFQEGLASGRLAKQDPQRLARYFVGAMRGMLDSAIRENVADLQAECRLVIDLFLDGAGAGPVSKNKGAR
jgi:TetR/AcrR family fatty acid metabolism transcriptional regulator